MYDPTNRPSHRENRPPYDRHRSLDSNATVDRAITALGLAAGVVLGSPAFVYGIAVILVVSAVSRWRLDLYGFLWRNVLIPIVGRPDEREPASPHRFAKLMGATFSALASVLLLVAGATGLGVLALVGYAVAAMVAILAGVASAFDYCIGCKMYRQVSFFRRLGWV